MRVDACQNGRAARGANGIAAEGVGKAHSFGGEAVDAGRTITVGTV